MVEFTSETTLGFSSLGVLKLLIQFLYFLAVHLDFLFVLLSALEICIISGICPFDLVYFVAGIQLFIIFCCTTLFL